MTRRERGRMFCLCACLCVAMLVWIHCAVGRSIICTPGVTSAILEFATSFCPRLFICTVLYVESFHGVPPSQPNAIFFTW